MCSFDLKKIIAVLTLSRLPLTPPACSSPLSHGLVCCQPTDQPPCQRSPVSLPEGGWTECLKEKIAKSLHTNSLCSCFIFHIMLIEHKLRIYLYSTMFCHLVDNQAHSFIPTRNCTTLVWSQKHFLVSIKCNCITYKTTFCSICKRKSILLYTEVSVYSTTTWVIQISVFRLLQMLKKYFSAL